MWRFVGAEKGMEPIPGIPLECSDEEFRAAERWYASQWPEGVIKGYPLRQNGLYEHTDDKPAAAPAKEA